MMKKHSALTVLTVLTGLFSATSGMAETHVIQEVAVEMNGAKFWIPSTITVKKGDTVKIHAVSKIPGAGQAHGFSIPDYKIEEVIDSKGKDIEFKADKAGVFPIKCQLHPAHVGGQLVVLE